MKFVIILVANGAAGAKTITTEEVDKFMSAYAAFPAWREALTHFKLHAWEPGNAMQLPNGWLFSVQDHIQV